MRTPQPLPAPFGRQLAEWRAPVDADPAIDEAVVRMLSAIDRHLSSREQDREQPSPAAEA